MSLLAIQGLTPEALVRAVPEVLLPEARKVVSAAHRFGFPLGPLQGVRKVALAAVTQRCEEPTLEVTAERRSALDPFVKYAMKTRDGHTLETVRIPLERAGRHSVCVSSQIGCALACAFCATGRMGLRRNLETWEIVEQVRIVKRGLTSGRVHGVVFQGMGEPMANLDRVLDAIRVMTDPSAMAIDGRAMTVSTAGLPAGIRRLAREAPKVRLALSIASARAGQRRSLMPIDAAHSLGEVMDAAVEHAHATGLAPLWALTLLSGVNDSPDDARALAELVLSFTARAGVRPRVSVIPYNAISDTDDPFARSSGEREALFRSALGDGGVFSHKRYSGGSDVNAACGQLAAKV